MFFFSQIPRCLTKSKCQMLMMGIPPFPFPFFAIFFSNTFFSRCGNVKARRDANVLAIGFSVNGCFFWFFPSFRWGKCMGAVSGNEETAKAGSRGRVWGAERK